MSILTPTTAHTRHTYSQSALAATPCSLKLDCHHLPCLVLGCFLLLLAELPHLRTSQATTVGSLDAQCGRGLLLKLLQLRGFLRSNFSNPAACNVASPCTLQAHCGFLLAPKLRHFVAHGLRRSAVHDHIRHGGHGIIFRLILMTSQHTRVW